MIDLNLVRVFVTIYDTRSVSAAALRLHVTQPSISYALSRLRTLLGDPLFTRNKDGMQPTFLATQLHKVFRNSLSEIERALALTKHFDPRQSSRCFRLALSDIGEIFFLPLILKALQDAAPDVELEIIPIEISRLDEWLKTGTIDAALCNRNYLPIQAKSELIFHEHYVCMVRENHPRVGPELSMENYISERHVVVSAGTGHRFVEDRLREAGIERKVSLRIPHFSALQKIISSSDLLVTLPSRVASLYAEQGLLRFVELPFSVPEIEVGLHWYEHSGDNSAQMWFCHFLKESLAGL